MNKSDLKKDDILVMKNNHSLVLGANNMYVIREYYDDELNCIKDDNYTIEKVFRPEYKIVFEREKGKEHGIKR